MNDVDRVRLYPVKQILTKTNYDKRTPLHLICKKGYFKMLMKIINYYSIYGIDLDPLDENGDTPLLLACSHGFDEELDLNDLEPTDETYLDMIEIFL